MPLIQYQQIAGTPEFPSVPETITSDKWGFVQRGGSIRRARALRPGQYRSISFDDPTTPTLITTQAGAAVVNQMIPKPIVIQYQSVTAPVHDGEAALPPDPEIAAWHPVMRGVPRRRPINRPMHQRAHSVFAYVVQVPVMSWTGAERVDPVRRRERARFSGIMEPPPFPLPVVTGGWGKLASGVRNRLVRVH